MNDNPDAASAGSWQQQLARRFAAMTEAERDNLRANAIRALDRATRARGLELDEVARLSALADYLAPRIERRRESQPASTHEAVLWGLMAGYQLAVGEASPQEADPFC